MAVTAQVPISSGTINGSAFTSADLVYGSATLRKTGSDVSTTTADNKIHRTRLAINYECDLVFHGDVASTYDNSAGVGSEMVLGGETFYGIATASYDGGSKTTTVSVKGNNLG